LKVRMIVGRAVPAARCRDFALEHPVKFRSASTSAVEPNVRPCRAMYSMTNLLIERG
jgi:hypothetical protein